MKPAAFEYYVPNTLDEALGLMAEHGYDAKILAGGQSLVPTMNFRLAQPSVLVDLNRLPELSGITPSDSGGVRIGAMTRQRTVERNQLVAERAPLVHDAMPYIAHVQIRNRGTFGGSLAHADPAAELPAIAVTTNARLKLQSSTGERWVDAEDFYIALFTTELTPQEIVTEIDLPPMAAKTGWSVQEVSRRQGDYAMAGATALVTLDESGSCKQVRITYLSVGDGPVVAHNAIRLLVGEKPTAEVIEEAANVAAQEDVDPISDIHASADYRRHLVKVLTKRVLLEATSRSLTSPV